MFEDEEAIEGTGETRLTGWVGVKFSGDNLEELEKEIGNWLKMKADTIIAYDFEVLRPENPCQILVKIRKKTTPAMA